MRSDQSIQRARAALRSFFVGDALSMPVHWYYNPLDILRAFPDGVTGMEAAPTSHPSSIMSCLEIVGDVILKGKRQFWGISNQHYHQGMPAGENTLNAWCARLLMRGITDHGSYDQNRFLESYINFMKADQPQHPDTHRGFFANLEAGNPPDKCAAITHDTPSIGGLVTIVPLALHLLMQSVCRQHLFLTHPDDTLARVCDSLIVLIDELLERSDDQDPMPLLVKAGKSIPKTDIATLVKKAPSDLHVIGRLYSSACYITDSYPCMLYLAGKYQSDTNAALRANTNAGGENAHRGAVLGGVVGLVNGDGCEGLFDQLLHRDAIADEIDQFLGV